MVLSKLAQFGQHMIGSILGRWQGSPQYIFVDSYFLLSLLFARLKYIPYSNKFHIVFSSYEVENLFNNFLSIGMVDGNEDTKILDPTSPEVGRVMTVLIKIVQALSDGLGFQKNCTVSVNYLPEEYDQKKTSQKDEINYKGLIVSRFNEKERVLGDHHGLGLKYDIEHLDGLNWNVFVVKSMYRNAYSYGDGYILVHDSLVHSARSEAELAKTLAHEVGHEVAMHASGYPFIPLWLFAIIPWPSAFWCPAFLLKLWDLIHYCSRRKEAEADYIGLMLMASAGYDPRQVPQFYEKRELDDYYLDTTHPSHEQRAKLLSRAEAMNRAVKIYEQVHAVKGITNII